MVHSVLTPGTVGAIGSLQDAHTRAYRLMLVARVLDDKMASLYRGGKIHGGVFLGRGQEALSVSAGLALRKGDIFAPLIRDQAGRLAFGEPVLDAVRTYLGSALGPDARAGRQRSPRAGPRKGCLPMISHLGAMISVVNGALMARRFKEIEGTVGAARMGEGGTSTGSFHEAMNQAAVEKLPLVLVVANNQYAYSTPNRRQFACRSLAGQGRRATASTAHTRGRDRFGRRAWRWSAGRSAQARAGRRAATGGGRDCCACAATASTTMPVTWTRT